MPHRYQVKVSGKADRALVWWLEEALGLFRALPKGWRATVVLEREEPPGGVESAPTT